MALLQEFLPATVGQVFKSVLFVHNSNSRFQNVSIQMNVHSVETVRNERFY